MHKAKFQIEKISGGYQVLCSKREMVKSHGRRAEKREKWVVKDAISFTDRDLAVEHGQSFVRKNEPPPPPKPEKKQ